MLPLSPFEDSVSFPLPLPLFAAGSNLALSYPYITCLELSFVVLP